MVVQGKIDVSANRSAVKWTRREQIGRILWTLIHPLFAFSPRPFWAWRRLLLRVFGASIGSNVHVYPSARITIPWNLRLEDDCAIGDRAILYALGPIVVAQRVTISQGAHLCAGSHDWRRPDMPLLKLPISIGADTWICADAFIGPNVDIGSEVIVGARAVAMHDVSDNSIVRGNPAEKIGSTASEKNGYA